MNGGISNDFNPPPFVLRLSKDERWVFKQNPGFKFLVQLETSDQKLETIATAF